MTILAHLGLWVLLTPILAGVLTKYGPREDDDKVMWVSAAIFSAMLIGIPVCLVCVVRFWWGG